MNPVSIARALNDGADSCWGNLGDWAPGRVYPEAARALALRLGEAVELSGVDRVVDLGSGCGDPLLLWFAHFGVGRIEAFEPDPHAAAQARAQLERAGLMQRVVLHEAPAAAMASLPPGSVDRVLALDCAYHFPDRRAVWRDAGRSLRPGGRIGFTDLLIGARPPRALRRVSRLFDIEADHWRTEQACRAELEDAGFDEVRVVCLTQEVLAGFAAHVRTRRAALLRRGAASVPIGLTALAASLCSARAWADYVLVTARRRS